ncbi:hypothetical protein GCM10009789_61920 [Kribbella sancticallisti]|uniref:CN hydrolase domain-containing protein n=1 Tax=Kribbella sancticallisti TaxID=460087 RepID=A0ABP4Q360_9ACTN
MHVAAYQVPEYRLDLDAALRQLTAALPDTAIACFPEAFLQGYLTSPTAARAHAFDLQSADFSEVLERLAGVEPTLVFGLIERDRDRLYNTAVVVRAGRLVGRYRKRHLLPGEAIFSAGDSDPVFELDGTLFGINICFDLQFPDGVAALAAQGVSAVLCPCNNMMRPAVATEYRELHQQMRQRRAREAGVWVISADVTGPTDADRVCYGPISAIDPSGEVVAQVPELTEGRIVVVV